jgi:Holliday junction resolvasome RuvABC endonuclease subunit
MLKSASKIITNKNRIIAIDPASHSLAWAIIDLKPLKLVATGKINLTKMQQPAIKFANITNGINEVCREYKPGVAVIEQSVYIQNFQSSRIISYIIGYTWGILVNHCSHVLDINPIIWKRGIGYKNLSNADKERLKNDTGKGSFEAKKKKERKQRVREIVEKYFDISSIDDDDIVDAIGIGMWYYGLGSSDGASTV